MPARACRATRRVRSIASSGPLRRMARRAVLVPLVGLLALAVFADGPFKRDWSSDPVASIHHLTAPPASGRRVDRQSFDAKPGSHTADSATNPAQSFPAPANLRPARSGPVSTYHVPVLMYHRIAPPSERGHDLRDLVLDPRRFEAQLAALRAHGWRTITSGELAAAIDTREPVPGKTFVITIDDGHADGYTHALPILARYGFVATFFVITGRIDRPGWLTWAELGEMQAAGMEIGNHTVSHVSEAGYSRAQTDAQVAGAQSAISTHLGAIPISFAYPYGRTPVNLIASLRAAGIKVAFTTAGGATETRRTAYLLPRLRVSATTDASGVLWLVRRYGSGPGADRTEGAAMGASRRCHRSTSCAPVVSWSSIHLTGPREGLSRRRPA